MLAALLTGPQATFASNKMRLVGDKAVVTPERNRWARLEKHIESFTSVLVITSVDLRLKRT